MGLMLINLNTCTLTIIRDKMCHFIFLAAILGCVACLKLNLLGQAITWCDEGLAVSFDYTFSSKSIFSVQGVHMKTKTVLLCLPIQKRFPIGGERVTCHGLKLSREKRQLELSTRT